MVNIIEENRSPSFSERLMQGASRAASEASSEIPKFFGHKMMEEHRKKAQDQEDSMISQLIGEDVSGLSHDFKKMLFEERIKGQSKASEMRMKSREKIAPYKQGLETIRRQRERLASGHLGPKMGGTGWQSPKLFSAMSAEGQKIRSGYEQAGKQLIQLASTLPIRNEKEFSVLADKLYDPSLNEAEIEGILDEMENHIKEALEFETGEKFEERESNNVASKNLDSNAMKKIYDLAKGDRQEARRIAKKMGYKIE